MLRHDGGPGRPGDGPLAKAVGMDERNLLMDCNESALNGLRDRGDFRALMMDLTMPSWPLARGVALNNPESAGDPPGQPTSTALSDLINKPSHQHNPDGFGGSHGSPEPVRIQVR
jgi:hypothetical protein